MGRVSVLARWLRLPLAPTAALDAVACSVLALGAAHGRAPWPDLLGWTGLVATSLLLYAYGMGLNDWADRERDLTLAPDRPLPSGALDARRALLLLALLAAGALALGGGSNGSRLLVGAALVAATLYDLWLKRLLVPGAALMGGVRALAAALVAAPLVHAGLAPWWVLLAPACVGLCSAGIHVLSTTEEGDSPERVLAARGLAAAGYGGAAALAMLAAGRLTLAAPIAAGTVLSLLFGRVPRAGPAKRRVLEMLLGLYLLAAVIAGGSGVWQVELLLLGVAIALVYLSQIAIRALRPRPLSAP